MVDNSMLSAFHYALFVCSFIFLLIGAGIASGLTIGLLSLDILKLQVTSVTGSLKERKYARALLPILKNQHFLLVSLLLANAACLEAMPIFLDRISSPILAVVISVVAVLFFGEVIPQALFKRYTVTLGYYMLPFVYTTLALTSPISWPVAALLDLVLEKRKTVLFNKGELCALIQMHGPLIDKTEMSCVINNHYEKLLQDEEVFVNDEKYNLSRPLIKPFHKSVLGHLTCQSSFTNELKGNCYSPELSINEVQLLTTALTLDSMFVAEVMIPLKNVFMLSTKSVIDASLIQKIATKKFSKIPIYLDDDRSQICGVLHSKCCLSIEPDDNSATLGQLFAGHKSSCFSDMAHIPKYMNPTDMLRVLLQGPNIAVVSSFGDRDLISSPFNGCNPPTPGLGELSDCSLSKLKPRVVNAIGIVTLQDVIAGFFRQSQLDFDK